MKNKKVLIIIISILSIIFILFTLFIIDYSRYLSGKKPIFVISTNKGTIKNAEYIEYSCLLYKVISYKSLYGRNDMEFVSIFSKPSVIEISDAEYRFIKDYFEKNEKIDEEDSKCFNNIKIYGLEEEKKYIKNIYAWVNVDCYYVLGRDIIESSGYSVPHKITINNKEDLIIEDVEYPRDGSLYKEDMKKLFPLSVRIAFDKFNYDQVKGNIKKQVEEYFYPLKLKND